MTVAPLDELSLLSTTADQGGALASVVLDVVSTDMNFLEGCVRFYPNGATNPIFLSSGTGMPWCAVPCVLVYRSACTFRPCTSGVCACVFLAAEDYFLSASYFDEGPFKTSQSGVTYKGGAGSVSMYGHGLGSAHVIPCFRSARPTRSTCCCTAPVSCAVLPSGTRCTPPGTSSRGRAAHS